MAHLHLEQCKRTESAKVQGIVGHTKHYLHPSDKADDRADARKGPYYENRKLDPPAVYTKGKVGP